MKRKLGIAVGVVVGLFVLVVLYIALSLSSGSVTSEEGTRTVELAMLTVPVAGVAPLIEAPDQYLGVIHADPEFDTSHFGPDLSFQQDPATLSALDPDRVLRAVYLGHDTHAKPYYIWQTGSPNFRQTVGQVLADFGAVGRLGSSYGGLVVGGSLWDNSLDESIAENGLTDGSIRSSSDGPTTFTLEWHALPEEVVAVVLYTGEVAAGWQRPVSGTVAFQSDIDSQDPQAIGQNAEMVALTKTGEEWKRYGGSTGFGG